ncbi:MAG: hypothetical protein FJ246_08570 [Nitrospira sp.]|nr:hypothetical protein [Nitrospira sp.]
MSGFRDAVGVILRAPVVGVLALLWIATIWPLIVGANVIGILGQPLVYPFAYTLEWLQYAFLGKKGEVLPDFWKGYPDDYIANIGTGFPTLQRWLFKGFED